MRRTKIVCTLGPATDNLEVLEKIVNNGMDVARFNFSHGEYEEHEKRLNDLRRLSNDKKIRVATMMDTRGPEIRLGLIKNGVDTIDTGDKFILTTEDVLGDKNKVHVNYKDLPKYLEKGNTIYLDDGNITLEVEDIKEYEIICHITDGGEISNRKKVTIPDVKTGLPAVTEADISDIKFGIKHHFDYIAASFVRSAEHVLEIRKILDEYRSSMKIISKIENREGLNNIEEIINVSDGIMVARGDLGVEIPQEEVPLRQKDMIRECRKAGKPVIIATQMLDSMMRNPRPTRAESSDVANAIFEGADAIMLSGETAVGKYPVEAVKTMANIANTTEGGINYPLPSSFLYDGDMTINDAIGQTVCSMAESLGVKAIIAPTQSGYTAKKIAKYRPSVPIIAITPDPHVEDELKLIWGVLPIHGEQLETTDEVLEDAVNLSLTTGLVEEGDLVILTAGVPVAMPGGTNLIKIHTIGKVIAQGLGIGDKSVTAQAVLVKDNTDLLDVKPNSIVVCHQSDASYVNALAQSAGIITESGGLSSHAAIVGINFGKPVIVNVPNIMQLLKSGELITMDCERGLIYLGRATIL
jgi:pyruvate kinase